MALRNFKLFSVCYCYVMFVETDLGYDVTFMRDLFKIARGRLKAWLLLLLFFYYFLLKKILAAIYCTLRCGNFTGTVR